MIDKDVLDVADALNHIIKRQVDLRSDASMEWRDLFGDCVGVILEKYKEAMMLMNEFSADNLTLNRLEVEGGVRVLLVILRGISEISPKVFDVVREMADAYEVEVEL